MNHVLNLLFNHGQKEQTKHTSRIIHGLERVSAGGLVSQLCVCSCRRADLQHPQKCSLIYGPRAALRGSAGTGSSSRLQTSAEPAAGPCCRRGERGWGPDSFIPLDHPIQKGTNWIFPRGEHCVLNRAGDAMALFRGTTLRVLLSFPTTLGIKPSSNHLLTFDCNLSTPIC